MPNLPCTAPRRRPLSNARKHAPGAPVTLSARLRPRRDRAGRRERPLPGQADAASPLSQTGAGLGLRGMRERIELLGGEVSAEPHDHGWTVRAAVPT